MFSPARLTPTDARPVLDDDDKEPAPDRMAETIAAPAPMISTETAGANKEEEEAEELPRTPPPPAAAAACSGAAAAAVAERKRRRVPLLATASPAARPHEDDPSGQSAVKCVAAGSEPDRRPLSQLPAPAPAAAATRADERGAPGAGGEERGSGGEESSHKTSSAVGASICGKRSGLLPNLVRGGDWRELCSQMRRVRTAEEKRTTSSAGKSKRSSQGGIREDTPHTRGRRRTADQE